MEDKCFLWCCLQRLCDCRYQYRYLYPKMRPTHVPLNHVTDRLFTALWCCRQRNGLQVSEVTDISAATCLALPAPYIKPCQLPEQFSIKRTAEVITPKLIEWNTYRRRIVCFRSLCRNSHNKGRLKKVRISNFFWDSSPP